MNSKEIKELIDEVRAASSGAGSDLMRRAELLASYLQSYHLAVIGEQLEKHNLEGFTLAAK